MSNTPIFTLTTDFGLADPYVGQFKGALLTGCPTAIIIDLTHAVPTWDVIGAAVTIRTSYPFFPPGTIHLVVVDPEVGSQRRLLAAAGDGHFFIAPDNGIFSLLVADNKIEAIHYITPPAFFSTTGSATFHGRDIIAPAAAVLAKTGSLGALGPAVPLNKVRMVPVPVAVENGGRLCGQVLGIDHFGNIRTSIRADNDGVDAAAFDLLQIGDQQIRQLCHSYSGAETGALLVVVDSCGYLEIAANRASAATLLGCAPGDPLTVHLVRPESA